MARVDEDPEDRDQEPLRLSQLVDCAMCKTTQEVEFVAPEGVYEAEDLTEAPETTHTCVNCGYEAEVTYAGWTNTQEA
jgi:ferredoxin-like protein FixX